MSEEYAFCKSVTIQNQPGKVNAVILILWLGDAGIKMDFDYTIETHHEKDGRSITTAHSWTFHFDNPKHAVAFKLVWG